MNELNTNNLIDINAGWEGNLDSIMSGVGAIGVGLGILATAPASLPAVFGATALYNIGIVTAGIGAAKSLTGK